MGEFESVTRAVYEWAKGYDRSLRLNALLEKVGDKSIYTNAASKVRTYIDGTVDRRFNVSLALMYPWSEGADGLNAKAMTTGESWLSWVGEQYPDNVPDLGDMEVLEIEVDDEVPVLVQVTADGKFARYQFQAHVDYRARR